MALTCDPLPPPWQGTNQADESLAPPPRAVSALADMASASIIPFVDTAPGGARVQGSRPRSIIVAKDQARTAVRSLHDLGDGVVALGFAGGTIGSPRGLQLRSGPQWTLVNEVLGAGRTLAPAPGGRFLLAAGALAGGYEAACHIVDREIEGEIDGYPLSAPYLWLSPPDEDGAGGSFIAKIPPHQYGMARSLAAPALVAAHPWSAALLDRPMQLVLVDRAARDGRLFLERGLPYRGAEHLAASPDGARVYFATQTTVGAVSASDGVVLWEQAIGGYGQRDFVSIYALAISADGRYLAIGGIAAGAQSGRALCVLDTETEAGDIVLSLSTAEIGGTSIRSLAWHPSGWLAAGSSSGEIAFVRLDGQLRIFSGAPKGIEAMLFVDGGASLLVGGSEKQLRLHPLFDEEREGRF